MLITHLITKYFFTYNTFWCIYTTNTIGSFNLHVDIFNQHIFDTTLSQYYKIMSDYKYNNDIVKIAIINMHCDIYFMDTL